MTRLGLLCFLAGALAGCLVPSLEDLEQERARTCDAEHPCLSNYLCVAGTCRPTEGLDCTPAATRPCGMGGGECREGTQTCSEAGAWGPCTGAVGPVTEVCDDKDNDCDGLKDESAVTSGCGVDAGVCAGKARACLAGVPEASCSAASFGADYESSETRCDGLDNDCDGMTDESLPPEPCEKTLGVCTGTTRTCTQGALPACTAATYLAKDPAWEAVETRCDAKDNDCDGLTDSWSPRLVTDGGTPSRRKVAAVVLPGTGSAARRDVLTLYEEGNRVVSQVAYVNGSSSAPRFPSVTITSVAKASSPALGANGTASGSIVAEAWFEELTGPVYRLAVATAGPQGEAITNGSPGVFPLTLPGAGQKVAVAVNATRIVLAYAHQDSPGSATTTVMVANCPTALNVSCATRALGAGLNPALLLSNDTALVVYESGSGLRLAKVAVPTSGMATLTSSVAFGGSNEHDAVLTGGLAALSIYSVVPGTPEALWQRAGDCSTTCDPTGFTTTPSVFTFSGTASSLTVDLASAERLLAWEDGANGRRVARVMALSRSVPLEVSPAGETGRRPVPIDTGTEGFEVFYDTEGGTGAAADDVLARRFCGP